MTKATKKISKDLETKDNKTVKSVLRKIKSLKENQKRLKIIKAVARGKAPWVNKVLLDALEDPSEEIRDFIIYEFGQREHLNLNMLYKKLSRAPWYVKSAVLKILGIRKNPISLDLIEVALKDSNADVRRSAAQALGEIGGKEALAYLAKLTKDKHHFVRKSAEEALRKASNLKFI